MQGSTLTIKQATRELNMSEPEFRKAFVSSKLINNYIWIKIHLSQQYRVDNFCYFLKSLTTYIQGSQGFLVLDVSIVMFPVLNVVTLQQKKLELWIIKNWQKNYWDTPIQI